MLESEVKVIKMANNFIHLFPINWHSADEDKKSEQKD